MSALPALIYLESPVDKVYGSTLIQAGAKRKQREQWGRVYTHERHETTACMFVAERIRPLRKW